MKLLLYIVAALLLITSCKKEQPELTPVNEDCDCASEVSADFKIEELNSPNFEVFYTLTDTAFANKNIRFSAQAPNAAYKWYLGAEVLSDSSFSRYFDNTTADTDVQVTLVVRKTPNSICFPGDDGYDSITKTLRIVGGNDLLNGNYNMEGTYRVIAPHVSDSINIVVEYYYNHPLSNGGGRTVMVYNWDGQGAFCEGNQGGGMGVPPVNYREFITEVTTNCGHVQLHVHRQINGEVLLDVGYRENSVNKTYHYKGRKL